MNRFREMNNRALSLKSGHGLHPASRLEVINKFFTDLANAPMSDAQLVCIVQVMVQANLHMVKAALPVLARVKTILDEGAF